MLAVSRRLRCRRIVDAARFDVGAALEAFQARDRLALCRDNALQVSHFAEQSDHQSLQLRGRQAINLNLGNHTEVESQPAASREPKKRSLPGVLLRLPAAIPKPSKALAFPSG